MNLEHKEFGSYNLYYSYMRDIRSRQLFHIQTMKSGQLWTENEVEQYQDLIEKYITDFRQIAIEMNRTYSQIRSHYYNLQRKPNVRALKINDKLPNQSRTVNNSVNQMVGGCTISSSQYLSLYDSKQIKYIANPQYTYIIFEDLD
ncbi:SANT/Myb_domain [Hexamita inflata]|uniref:SANT/Myb domain n=1 Tax=Hexamita inflata TaxID=28002 RepID=A0AA86PYZ2_9EUKA|nr:SANT/Myb domain [Hexamita inflata]